MKIQDLLDVTVKFAGDLVNQSFAPGSFWKTVIDGMMEGMRRKGGSAFLADTPVAKKWLKQLEDLKLYNPDKEEVDSEALFAFLDHFVKSGKSLPVGRFGIVEVPNSDLKAWVKKLKEVENYGKAKVLPAKEPGFLD